MHDSSDGKRFAYINHEDSWAHLEEVEALSEDLETRKDNRNEEESLSSDSDTESDDFFSNTRTLRVLQRFSTHA